uniref:Uncharacterized protein n=1 Tax=Glossina brevipalpis TaxID=37001 RepID=A0A1A9WM58_9MUSC
MHKLACRDIKQYVPRWLVGWLAGWLVGIVTEMFIYLHKCLTRFCQCQMKAEKAIKNAYLPHKHNLKHCNQRYITNTTIITDLTPFNYFNICQVFESDTNFCTLQKELLT